MKKAILIISVIILVIVILVFLFFVGFSKISTNKDIYKTREEVIVSFSDFRLLRCNTSPSITNMLFYYETSEGWKRIIHEDWHVTWGGIACVDGKPVHGVHPGDIQRCTFFILPYKSGTYTWDSKVYESKGVEEICGELEKPVPSFQSKPASPGKYKVKFGSAQKIFEIKEAILLEQIIPQGEEQEKETRSNKVLTLLTKVPADYRNFADRYVALSSLDITTGEKTELTRWAACEATIVLSPDKNKIAYFIKPNDRCEKEYYEGGDGHTELWISDISGKDKQPAARWVWKFTTPKWSADGKYVAYDRVIEHPYPQEREHILLVYDLQKKTEQSLGSFFGAAHKIIGFSQGSESVYYNDGQFLYKVDISNQDREKIYTHEYGFYQHFVVSPDSRSIAVFKEEDWYGGKTTPLETKIGVIETSTGKYRELYNGTDAFASYTYRNSFVFLPDNSRVVYGTAKKGEGGLWAIDITTGERKELEETSSSTLHGIAPIALSADGDLVLYSGWASETTYYYTISLSTGVVTNLENTRTATPYSGERFLDWLN
ncbi:hypothetical protein KJA15_04360 [Patescibacteria group bacterium]|nr:hypothetical protein [Patescibacteria group bacterium]